MKFIFVALLCVVNTYSQEDAKLLYQGNNQYFDSNYVHSTSSFREALKINPKNYKASFNLGNAMYRNAGEIRTLKWEFCKASKR
ncbi:MAG: hypothetical protein IPJ60_16610 [Sphingobacteriaceae bacterium]|nr:hypothetical protein [Sphingobacteriaceae bacterium]